MHATGKGNRKCINICGNGLVCTTRKYACTRIRIYRIIHHDYFNNEFESK